MTFAEQLKSQRQRLGLTQSEVADLLEVSASWTKRNGKSARQSKSRRKGRLLGSRRPSDARRNENGQV
jgi:transcriptional regulator with XRE-family HTH domain